MRRFLGFLIALSVPTWGSTQPSIAPLGEMTLLGGSPLHVPLDGADPGGAPLAYTVVTSDPLVEGTILGGERALRVEVAEFGTMVFALFDGRASRATNRIVELADSGFYDGVIFHRIINNFVIQGGDPTGTGAGGSTLGNFADQFHVDLQHNRTGLLSMAKSSDDTNDSQFFITEGSQRHLDFNHTIFGLLIEGEPVRDAISNVSTGAGDRPSTDVVMQQVRSFVDTQNGVLMLKAPEGATGAVDVTVTVTNDAGQSAQTTFRVNVTPDTVNSPPFLADIPELTTEVDVPITYQLVALDAEGDAANFLDEVGLAANGLAVPVTADPRLDYRVDFETGLVTITPTGGMSGRFFFTVATGVSVNAIDYEVVPVTIGTPRTEGQ